MHENTDIWNKFLSAVNFFPARVIQNLKPMSKHSDT